MALKEGYSQASQKAIKWLVGRGLSSIARDLADHLGAVEGPKEAEATEPAAEVATVEVPTVRVSTEPENTTEPEGEAEPEGGDEGDEDDEDNGYSPVN